MFPHSVTNKMLVGLTLIEIPQREINDDNITKRKNRKEKYKEIYLYKYSGTCLLRPPNRLCQVFLIAQVVFIDRLSNLTLNSDPFKFFSLKLNFLGLA